MAKARSLPIRQIPEPPQVISVQFETPRPQAHPQLRLPLCISWSYESRLVLCVPYYSDEGRLLNLTWSCPLCLHTQQFALDVSVLIAPKTGRLSVSDVLRCARASCDLLVEIQDGMATRTLGAD